MIKQTLPRKSHQMKLSKRQEEIIPKIIQEAITKDEFILSDKYDNDSSSESDDEHNDINIDRLQKI